MLMVASQDLAQRGQAGFVVDIVRMKRGLVELEDSHSGHEGDFRKQSQER